MINNYKISLSIKWYISKYTNFDATLGGMFMTEIPFRDCNDVLQNDRLNIIMSDKSKSLAHNLLSFEVLIGLEDGVRAEKR